MLFLRALTIILIAFSITASGANEPANPTITFENIPPYGTTELLRGRAQGLEGKPYAVAVAIFVAGGWWTKPTWENPTVTVGIDGRWTANINTGESDRTATRIAAFLVPANTPVPLAKGEGELPKPLREIAMACVEYERPAPSRIITFAGFEWDVKSSSFLAGPGPNFLSDGPENVWVDAQDRLHLRIAHVGGQWRCAEVVSRKRFGYGTYTFMLATQVELLDPQAVAGLFTWDDAPESAHREIDIEFSRWGDPKNEVGQFVVQPWQSPGNRHRFAFLTDAHETTSMFEWTNKAISFQSRKAGTAIPEIAWTYTDIDIPAPGNEHVHINLWLFEGKPPIWNKPVELVVSGFIFTPSID